MRDSDAAGVPLIVQRDAAGDRDRILTQASVDREFAFRAFHGSGHFVDYRQQGIGRTSGDQSGLSNCRSGLDKEIERIVIYSKRCDFSAVVPGQIFPVPTGAILWTNKVTFIADEITLNTLHACDESYFVGPQYGAGWNWED